MYFSLELNEQCLFFNFTKAFLVWMNDFEMVVYLDFGVLLWWCI